MPLPAHLLRRRVLGAATVLAALTLTACSPGLSVDSYPTEKGSEVGCGALYADLPRTVGGLDSILVEDDVAAAWGTPAVVLRCGVGEPDALEPTSRCDMVADVGWFTETTHDGFLFTTIGREFSVSVEVPEAHAPAADVLVDLAGSIEKHDPDEEPCV